MAKTKSSSTSKTIRSKKNEASADNPAVTSAVTPVNQTTAKAESVKTKAVKPEAIQAKGAKIESAKPDSVQSESNGRIFEVKKPELRKNLIPINIEDEIRRRAYELSEQRGFTDGSEAEDWLRAEGEVMQRYRHQQSA